MTRAPSRDPRTVAWPACGRAASRRVTARRCVTSPESHDIARTASVRGACYCPVQDEGWVEEVGGVVEPRRTHGGRRAGAGRKKTGKRVGVPHRARPELSPRHPVHVTLRVRRWFPELRRRDCYAVIRRVLARYFGRDDFRIIHGSIQNTHFHFLIEARDRRALSRGMQSLAIRLARALTGGRGKVFGLALPRGADPDGAAGAQHARVRAQQLAPAPEDFGGGRQLPHRWIRTRAASRSAAGRRARGSGCPPATCRCRCRPRGRRCCASDWHAATGGSIRSSGPDRSGDEARAASRARARARARARSWARSRARARARSRDRARARPRVHAGGSWARPHRSHRGRSPRRSVRICSPEARKLWR